MKVRTKEQLFDLISEDLGWRRIELTAFQRMIDRADTRSQSALLRASVALLYAHWEGFIKNACHWYYCFLASQRLSVQQLRPELAAVSARAKVVGVLDTRKSAVHADFVRDLRERAAERARIPTGRDAVRTQSNLSYEVLHDVLTAVGCDPEIYEDDRDLINEELVAVRNRVVHGEYDVIRPREWEELRAAVLTMMESVADQVISAAVDETYLAWKA